MNNYEIDLRQLRCLVTLAEELNFGRAAERMHMSQPPLTRLVAEVEKALGAKLFTRTTRRVALTPIGEFFVAEATVVLARAEEAMQNVSAAIDRQNGLLRLAYTPLALQTVLPPLLAAFREKDHDTHIDLVELAGAAQQEALNSGWIDLALCDAPLKDEQSNNLLLHREPLFLVMPETHPLAASTLVSLKSLHRETLILHMRQEYPDYYDRVLAACNASGGCPNIREREAGQNCMALVIGGAGLLLSPASLKGFQSPGLHCVEIDACLNAEVWMAWVKKKPAGRIKTLIEIAQRQSANYSKLPD